MHWLDEKRAHARNVIANLGRDSGPLIVGQIMTPRPTCVQPELSVYELVKLFHREQFRHLLVADAEGRLAGVISDRDVLRCFGPSGAPAKEVLTAITVGQIMSADLVAVPPQMPVQETIGLLIDCGISCLPVVDEGRLVGILTSTDLHLVLETMLGPGPLETPHALPAASAAAMV